METGSLLKNIYDYTKDNDVPFVGIMGHEVACFTTKLIASDAFYFMSTIPFFSDCGQINSEVEEVVKEYANVYMDPTEMEYDETDFDTEPDVIIHLRELCTQFKNSVQDENLPWLLSYEIKIDGALKRITETPMVPFLKYPAYNIMQYIANYGSVSEAATEFIETAMLDDDRTDYMLFDKYHN